MFRYGKKQRYTYLFSTKKGADRFGRLPYKAKILYSKN
jgi:hypothetical protein